MDYILGIFILKSEISKLGLHEVLREWGGSKYSENPELYSTDLGIEFRKIEDMSFYSRLSEIEFKPDVIGLYLISDILYDFEYYVNKKIPNEKAGELLELLKILSELSFVCMFLIREDEGVKEKYEIVTPEGIEDVLFKCLDWASPKDIMLYKMV